MKKPAALLWLVVPAMASAHSRLIESDPANGEVRERAVERVIVRYSQELDTQLSRLQVFDSEGAQLRNGSGGVDLDDPDHASLIVRLPAALAAGRYTVRWMAVSAEDEDQTEGRFTFEVKGRERSIAVDTGRRSP